MNSFVKKKPLENFNEILGLMVTLTNKNIFMTLVA